MKSRVGAGASGVGVGITQVNSGGEAAGTAQGAFPGRWPGSPVPPEAEELSRLLLEHGHALLCIWTQFHGLHGLTFRDSRGSVMKMYLRYCFKQMRQHCQSSLSSPGHCFVSEPRNPCSGLCPSLPLPATEQEPPPPPMMEMSHVCDL